MGQVLHGSATTTAAVRRAIQHSQESLRVLARRYGINPKTVAKWKRRTSVVDLPTGPAEAKSTVLSVEDEAIIVAFRQHTPLPIATRASRAGSGSPAQHRQHAPEKLEIDAGAHRQPQSIRKRELDPCRVRLDRA